MFDTKYDTKYNKGENMSKWNKLISRVCAFPSDIRFYELKKILEYYGYVMTRPRSGSSHCTFRKEGKMPITIPQNEPIKKVYVELVIRVIESEEKDNENS